jgi:pumilio family protein 6
MFSLIHRIFLEYFQNCDQKQKSEMIDLLSEHLVHMIHTKDGANVAMNCIWHGDAKDRKKIIKGMKSFFLKVASEEHGHLVLLAIFDSVDDTKLVSKVVLEVGFFNILISIY